MPIVTVRNQEEWNALPAAFTQPTTIELRTPDNQQISIRRAPHLATVTAVGRARVDVSGSCRLLALDETCVWSWGPSRVRALDRARVRAFGGLVAAEMTARVVAAGTARVVASDLALVEAYATACVEARSTAHVRVFSPDAQVRLLGFAVAHLHTDCEIDVASPTATCVRVVATGGALGWCEREGVLLEGDSAVVFKRVSRHYETQEDSPRYRTLWKPGVRLEHPAWDPRSEECGGGKYHACSTPAACDAFRSDADDRYVAIRVRLEDMHAWEPRPMYWDKIAFRAGEVLYECDRDGNPVGVARRKKTQERRHKPAGGAP